VPKTKLQKQLSRKAKGKEYAKWVLVIPPPLVKKLNWGEGDEIKPEINEGKLVLLKVEGE